MPKETVQCLSELVLATVIKATDGNEETSENDTMVVDALAGM
jgi:hypothetical protein